MFNFSITQLNGLLSARSFSFQGIIYSLSDLSFLRDANHNVCTCYYCSVLYHTSILPIHIWGDLYAYDTSHAGIVGSPCFTHMHMSVSTHISISDYEHIESYTNVCLYYILHTRNVWCSRNLIPSYPIS